VSYNNKSSHTLQTNESNSSLMIKKNCNQFSNINININDALPLAEQEKLLSMDKQELLSEIKL